MYAATWNMVSMVRRQSRPAVVTSMAIEISKQHPFHPTGRPQFTGIVFLLSEAKGFHLASVAQLMGQMNMLTEDG